MMMVVVVRTGNAPGFINLTRFLRRTGIHFGGKRF